MRRVLLTIVIILIVSIKVICQNNIEGNENTLIVKGIANLKEIPELVKLTISIKSESKNYNNCQDRLVIAYNVIKSRFINIGIADSLLKSRDIQVFEKTDYINNKTVKAGFIGDVSLILESKYSVEFMKKILSALKSDTLHVDYKISFTLSEQQKTILRQKAIVLAINDAIEKAKTISEASDVNLIVIKSITFKDENDWNSSDRDIIREDEYWNSLSSNRDVSNKSILNFNPKEIVIQKSVLIEWIIQEKK